MTQPMSAWNWVTPTNGRWNRCASALPASFPVPVTTVPAAKVSDTAPTSVAPMIRRSRRTVGTARPSPSWTLMCSTTAAPTMPVESMKWAATQAGLSLVSTTIPPTTAWAITPPGSAAASQMRSRRRRAEPGGREQQGAMKVSPAMATSGKFSSRLPNSIQVFSVVCPAVFAAIRLLAVQSGQSGQPSPDLLSRTASPVDMMITLATTAASANRRSDTRVGCSTGRERRSQACRQPGRAGVTGSAGGGDAGCAGTLPIVGDRPRLRRPVPPARPGGAGAGCDHAADRGPLGRRQVLPEQEQPDQRGHGRLDAHPDAEHLGRQPAQGLHLQPVRDG